ncbi:MAG: hypothetical protein K0S58_2427 [Nitrospira sp.]|jgi:hypothetical protein|nr:hypothetical protein [Nitrospira sp.]
MPIRKIPEDVRRFIQTSIDSIAQLEALLIAHEQQETEWTVAAMAARLYISPERTAAILARLCGDRLMVTTRADLRYKYQPDSDELRHMVDRLAEAYAKHLVPVTRLVHSKEGLRIREFPDAFDFRKERP